MNGRLISLLGEIRALGRFVSKRTGISVQEATWGVLGYCWMGAKGTGSRQRKRRARELLQKRRDILADLEDFAVSANGEQLLTPRQQRHNDEYWSEFNRTHITAVLDTGTEWNEVVYLEIVSDEKPAAQGVA